MLSKKLQSGSFLSGSAFILLLFAVSLNICARPDKTLYAEPVQSQNAIHILFSSLDAGLTLTEGFRLTRSGYLSYASWDSDNRLSGLSGGKQLAGQAYSDAVTILSNLQQPLSEGEDGVSFSPAVNTLELVLPHTTDNKRHQVFPDDDIPTAVLALLTQWRQSAPLQSVAAGHYLWAIPAPSGQIREDIKIPSEHRPTGLEAAILRGLSGDAPVVSVDGELDNFLTGERRYKTRFSARLRNSFAYFGVLSAP